MEGGTGSFLATWESGGRVTHTAPTLDVPRPSREASWDPLASPAPKLTRGGGHSGGVWALGSACCVSPGQGVGSWARRRYIPSAGAGGAWGEGLLFRVLLPILHPEFLHTSGAVLYLGVNQPETAPPLAVQSPQARPHACTPQP